MDPDGSLPCSRDLASGSSFEPDGCSPQPKTILTLDAFWCYYPFIAQAVSSLQVLRLLYEFLTYPMFRPSVAPH
jgi:hypothetical protein